MGKVNLGYNELPHAPSTTIMAAASDACTRANRYPEWNAASLCAAIAEYYAIEPNWVVAAGGSAAIIHQVMIASGQQEVIFGWPGFDAFPMLAAGLRMHAIQTQLKDGAPDLTDMLARITEQTSLIIVCTPNSPTGGIISHRAMESFLKQVPARVTVLIDEAYAEFVRDTTKTNGLDFASRYANVVVSRTFSKAYGLAGFRVGYAIAQPELASKIFLAGIPFSVPLPAQAAAIEALKNASQQHSLIDELLQERDRMAQRFRDLGHEVWAGHGNFIWLPLEKTAETIAQALAEYGILVKAVPGHGIRITVGTKAETDALMGAWHKLNI